MELCNVDTVSVVMSRNLDRNKIKRNISVRVPVDVLQAFSKLAGSLNVPVSDLVNYVLKQGIVHLREIKEI